MVVVAPFGDDDAQLFSSNWKSNGNESSAFKIEYSYGQTSTVELAHDCIKIQVAMRFSKRLAGMLGKSGVTRMNLFTCIGAAAVLEKRGAKAETAERRLDDCFHNGLARLAVSRA